jgi:hypothetical protein
MARGIITLGLFNWAIRVVFIAILFITLALLVDAFLRARVDVFPQEARILAGRLLTSPVIASQDPGSLRVQPGTVDLDKFIALDESKLDALLHFSERHLAMEVRLRDTRPCGYGKGRQTASAECEYALLLEERFLRFLEVPKLAGLRSAKEATFDMPVIITKQGKDERPRPGTLTVRVLAPA